MPATLRYLDTDMVTVYETGADGKKKRLATLLWGDSVKVKGKSGDFWKLDFTTRVWDPTKGEKGQYVWKQHDAFIAGKTKFRDTPLLKVRFVDVGQGDGAIIESPKGQIILVDGGEEEHIYHYFTASWAHLLRTKAVELAAIVVTHGDADHFDGLATLVNGWGPKGKPPVTTRRVFHNGLVKRPSGTKDMLGKTAKKDGVTYAVALEDDLLAVATSQMNNPFALWQQALLKLKQNTTGFKTNRLAYGDDDAFSFLHDEDIDVQVPGPRAFSTRGRAAIHCRRVTRSTVTRSCCG